MQCPSITLGKHHWLITNFTWCAYFSFGTQKFQEGLSCSLTFIATSRGFKSRQLRLWVPDPNKHASFRTEHLWWYRMLLRGLVLSVKRKILLSVKSGRLREWMCCQLSSSAAAGTITTVNSLPTLEAHEGRRSKLRWTSLFQSDGWKVSL